MKLFRKENIEKICNAMMEDTYDDNVWESQNQGKIEFGPAELKEFILRNISGKTILEIGCGKGRSFSYIPVTHALEPNYIRFMASKQNDKGVVVKQGFSECLPYRDKMFDSVLAIRVWEHVRSDFESLIEINRVLKDGGIFIFTLTSDEKDSVAGRNFSWKNYERFVKDFGFELVEKREVYDRYHYLCFAWKKCREFDARYLNKPQVVGKINNYLEQRDWVLL